MDRKKLVIREDSIVYTREDAQSINDTSRSENIKITIAAIDSHQLVLKQKLEGPIDADSKNISLLNKNKTLSKVQLRKKLTSREEFRKPLSREKVLDEDHYLSLLETLIQRDYFPDLYRINEEKVSIVNKPAFIPKFRKCSICYRKSQNQLR